MALISGVVEKKGSRVAGDGNTYWDLTVNGVRYGFGRNQPKCNEGDNVSFEASQNDKGFWNANVKTLARASAPVAAPTVPAAAGNTRAWFPDDKRQDSITYQSARKDAIEVAKALLSAGLMEFGAKAKLGDKQEITLALIDKMTVQYFNDTKVLMPLSMRVSKSENKVVPADPEFDDELDF